MKEEKIHQIRKIKNKSKKNKTQRPRQNKV
jgi:hypothetical protein